jgi:GTPase
MMTSKRTQVVIVGRPNVGKSTLFNRLARQRRALTHDLPGMTRDRLSQLVELSDGRKFELTDTGGLEYGDDVMSDFAGEIKGQARKAIEAADLILFVVDGTSGVMPEDEDIAAELRGRESSVIVVVNKSDRRDADYSEAEFHRLGFRQVISISAEHAINTDVLEEMVEEIVRPEDEAADDADSEPIAVGIIGRPNVGKSSLLNRLLGEERSVVSSISGTTRDAIDSPLERNGKKYLIIDTAGIRRKGKTTDEAEKLAVISARKAIERCEVALVVIDAVEGITAQDATVAGYAEQAGKAAIILVNKWDAIETTPTLARETELEIRRKLKFLSYAPIEFISAKSGRRVEKIFPVIDRVVESFRRKLKTAELNQILEKAAQGHTPPSVRGKPRRFYYATQLKSQPPTIAIFSNVNEPLHFSYKRYMENQFREALGLVGSPVHLIVRGRKGMRGE